MASQTLLTLPDGRTVALHRRPDRSQADNLRAWDAADEYVLTHVASTAVDTQGVVIAGDGFGALAVGLADRKPTWWSDSAVQEAAARANLSANGVDPDELTWLPATHPPSGPVNLAVVKVPKSTALLEHLLTTLRPQLGPTAQVIGAGMTRNVHSSTVAAFSDIIGPTTTSLARKKARLILSSPQSSVEQDSAAAQLDGDGAPDAATFALSDLTVTTMPGVFSAGRLDPGTDLLLSAMPTPNGPADVVDLGCGNGVVGTVIARNNPHATITFTDQSHLAVASARATWAAAHGTRNAVFTVADGLSSVPDGSADMVVVNPPFHQGHVQGDEVAWRMFGDARRVLRPGGRIVAVGNRHLAYHAKLQRLYGNAEVLASNNRFVVCSSIRR